MTVYGYEIWHIMPTVDYWEATSLVTQNHPEILRSNSINTTMYNITCTKIAEKGNGIRLPKENYLCRRKRIDLKLLKIRWRWNSCDNGHYRFQERSNHWRAALEFCFLNVPRFLKHASYIYTRARTNVQFTFSYV